MATFQDLLNNVHDPKQHWEVRLQLMREIEQNTWRWLIVYAADFRCGIPSAPNSIEDCDLIGFSDLIGGATVRQLGVLIHSPFGSAKVTEQIVDLLRSNFDDIRFIAPRMAMSAATMLCLSGNCTLMDNRSALDSIDPKIRISLPHGEVWFPAQVLIDEFERAKSAITEELSLLPVYLPCLSQFGPFVQVCRNALALFKELFEKRVSEFMFANEPDANERAHKVANYFADHNLHKSHVRTILITQVVAQGVKVMDMRQENRFSELIWRLDWAIDLYFDRTPAVKSFENAHGVSWTRNVIEKVAILPTLTIVLSPQTQTPQ